MPKLWTNLILAGVPVLGAALAFTQSSPAPSSAAAVVPVHSAPAETKPAPATPIDAKKAELGGNTWDPDWDHFIEKNLP